MGDGAFDIYQGASGYVAVTNAVQRQILDALRLRERQLPDLVELTGRSKPTLSSLHMKELLARELIEERNHPTDSRRKVYRLRAAKIGSSDLPVAQLREAVQHYVALSPLAARFPLRDVLVALVDVPRGTPPEAVGQQAQRAGAGAGRLFKVADLRGFWLRLSALFEQEGVATTLRVDLQRGALDVRLDAALAQGAGMAGPALAGFASGMAQACGLDVPGIAATDIPEGLRLQVASRGKGRPRARP